MFNSIVAPSVQKSRAARWTTAAVSAVAHVGVLALLIVPALFATDVLPPPREAMNFFVASPPPPPPPPPPAVDVTPPPARKAPAVKTARVQPAAPVRPIAAAPVEAPSSIAPETGLEGIAPAVAEAGFERGMAGGIVGGVAGGFEHGVPPPPPPRPTAPVRVGGEVKAPRLLQRVEPEYPLIAAAAQIEGVVILEATVGRDGRVDEVSVLRAHQVLEDAAVAAVKQWVYEPLMLNGAPEPFVLTVTVSFSLGR